jgi:hypothetical protein
MKKSASQRSAGLGIIPSPVTNYQPIFSRVRRNDLPRESGNDFQVAVDPTADPRQA